MSKYTWILDAGHGGVDKNGNYTTDQKLNKRFRFNDGFEILEGVINRKVTQKLYTMLMNAGVDFVLVYDEINDWTLQKRVQLANQIHGKKKNCIYLSIHSNAGKGNGFEVFTSIGETKSDKIADYFCRQYKKDFPNYKFRADTTDGDLDKEADFYVLKNTNCPAVLVENLFFDERSQAEYLSSEKGQDDIARCLFNAIREIETTKPI
jgi:N-acetylmuramoyl-L-alanine amidase